MMNQSRSMLAKQDEESYSTRSVWYLVREQGWMVQEAMMTERFHVVVDL